MCGLGTSVHNLNRNIHREEPRLDCGCSEGFLSQKEEFILTFHNWMGHSAPQQMRCRLKDWFSLVNQPGKLGSIFITVFAFFVWILLSQKHNLSRIKLQMSIRWWQVAYFLTYLVNPPSILWNSSSWVFFKIINTLMYLELTPNNYFNLPENDQI
jgi:hypothetical protein